MASRYFGIYMEKNFPKKIIEIFNKYHSSAYLEIDPLVCVRRFIGMEQLEITALVSALLAYGRVDQIIKAVERILSIADQNLLQFTMNSDFDTKMAALKKFKYRFNNGTDIAILLEVLKHVIREFGSIEQFFCHFLNAGNGTMSAAMTGFSDEIIQRGREISSECQKSFAYLFPSPKNGSACKRLNMFFRWVIRDDDGIDLGIWSEVPSCILVIPVDTHVAKVSRSLKLTERKSADWKMAEDITEKLREISIDDPVKFDFSLCRYGMIDLPKK